MTGLNETESERRAVILVSGGLDSATVLGEARAAGFACYALTFDYGQRHHCELAAAERVCAAGGAVKQVLIKLDLRALGGSALTAEIDVPKHRSDEAMATGIPITYVPARNTIFLSVAMGWAEILGAQDLFVGVNAVDYSGYPDCRPEYLDAFAAMAKLATKAGVEGQPLRIHAPLLHLNKAEIIRRAVGLGVDLSLTSSCYDPLPEGTPCGECDACRLRQKGFQEAGLADPAG